MNVGIGDAIAAISLKRLEGNEQTVGTNVSAKMLWRLGMSCFQWKLNEVRNCEKQLEPHCGGSYDSEAWRRTPYKYQGRIAVVGSLREVAGNFAACG